VTWPAGIVLDKPGVGGLAANRRTPIIVGIVASHGLTHAIYTHLCDCLRVGKSCIGTRHQLVITIDEQDSIYIVISGSTARSFWDSGISVKVASVNNNTLATDTAFSNATRTTFTGSTMPASTRSTYSLRAASNP